MNKYNMVYIHRGTLQDLLADRLELQRVKTRVRFLEGLVKTYERIVDETPSCNDCAISKICKICPKWGDGVRYNCIYHVPMKKG